MKTKIIISFLGLLLIAGAFTEGCEEEEPKPDFIKVLVSVDGTLWRKQVGTGDRYCDSLCYNVPIKVVITKDGGENFILYPTTPATDCYYQTDRFVSFNLYRDQPIEVEVSTQFVHEGHTLSEGYKLLEWSDVYPANDFGEEYSWNPYVEVYWLFN